MGSVEKGLIGQGSHNHSASHKSKCSPTPPCAFKHVLAINTSLGSGKTSFPHSTVCWMERVKLLPTTYLFGDCSCTQCIMNCHTVLDLNRHWPFQPSMNLEDSWRSHQIWGEKNCARCQIHVSLCMCTCMYTYIYIYIHTYIHMYGIQYNIHYSYVSSPEDHWIKIIEQRSLLSIPKLLPSSWVT